MLCKSKPYNQEVFLDILRVSAVIMILLFFSKKFYSELYNRKFTAEDKFRVKRQKVMW